MAITFASLIPNGDDLLQLEVEELAGVLLMVLNSYPEPDRIAFQRQSNLHRSGLCKALSNNPQYPGLQNEINKALMEAWSWLQSESFLIVDPYASDWFFVSRSGKRLKSRDDLDSYRKANLLPKGQLHPVIASRVYPAFLRGDYETAIFQAFKEVEICVRRAGQFLPEMSGIDLMRRAFSPSNGPLTDMGLPAGERDRLPAHALPAEPPPQRCHPRHS